MNMALIDSEGDVTIFWAPGAIRMVCNFLDVEHSFRSKRANGLTALFLISKQASNGRGL